MFLFNKIFSHRGEDVQHYGIVFKTEQGVGNVRFNVEAVATVENGLLVADSRFKGALDDVAALSVRVGVSLAKHTLFPFKLADHKVVDVTLDSSDNAVGKRFFVFGGVFVEHNFILSAGRRAPGGERPAAI